MTISTTQSQVVIAGNGVTQEFSFNFVADQASDIVVTYTNASNVATVLSPSQYTLTLNPPSSNQIWGVGGSVLYPLSGSPIATGTSLTISRVVPLQQLTSISNQGDFYPQVVEQAMDNLEMQIQQVSARGGQYRGVWQTGTTYNFGDYVTDGANGANTGNIYLCSLTNTSGTWTTDLASGDWTLAIQSVFPTATLPLSIANGGTSATTAAAALTALGGVSSTGATFSGAVGIGAAPSPYQLKVVLAGSSQGYFGSTGANSATVVVDNAAGGQQDSVYLADAGIVKWGLNKTTSNTCQIYDYTGSKAFFTAISGGNLTLGAAQTTSIAQNGNVAIGGQLATGGAAQTSDASLLVYGSSTSSLWLRDSATGAGTGNGLQLTVDGTPNATIQLQSNNSLVMGSNSTENFRINYVGGVNNIWQGCTTAATTSSGGRYIVDSNGAFIQLGYNGSGSIGQIAFFRGSAGSLAQVGSITTTNTGTAFNTTSDKRLKNNVTPLSSSGTKIDALQPVTYSWQYIDGNPTGVGFLAQDLYAIIPEAVSVGDSGQADAEGKVAEQWSVDYSKLVPYLVAELQAVRIRLAALEAKDGITPAVN